MVKPDWEDTRRELIDTYKTLNHRVRVRDERELAAEHNGDSIRSEIAAMRRHEFQFANALSTALAGDAAAARDASDDVQVIGTETGEESTTMLISQFGNARATTLNTMSSVADEVWDRQLIENRRMLDLAKDLAESDRTHLAKITRMLGG